MIIELFPNSARASASRFTAGVSLKHVSIEMAFAGGGGVYLHYAETVPSGGYAAYSSNCYTCTSRGGWGGYGLANLSYFLDRNRTFHVGTTFEFIAGSTNGQAVADIPSTKTTDHWTNIFIEFGMSF